MKRWLVLLMALVMVLSMVGCGQQPPAEPEEPAEGGESANVESGDSGAYKIGIVTGTVSQGEEEFRAGEKLVKENPEKFIHVTYPDKFAQEQETTISNMKALADNPDVKAIVMCQAVPGFAPAVDQIRDARPDLLIIAGAPHEDPDVVAARADIALDLDQYQRGRVIMETAKDMGAETFIHYSFPRHMSMALLSARRDELKKAAEDLGIEFVEVDAPDPTGDGGTPATQQFVKEDIPRELEKYGENTAFFGTNCGMQEAMIATILKEGGLFPEQCCPSPYHAYPNALGIEIPADKAGDLDFLNESIEAALAEKGGTGRFATWTKPANVAMINAGVEYAEAFIAGDVERDDADFMIECMKHATDGDIIIHPMDGYDNFLLFTIGSQRF